MSFLDAIARLARAGAVEAESHFEELKADLSRRLGLESFDLHIQAYRGYGTPTRLHVAARVLRGRPLELAQDHHTLWDNVFNAYRRFESDEVPGAGVQLALGSLRAAVTADQEGYVRVALDLPPDAAVAGGWHDVELTLTSPEADADGAAVRSVAPVLVPGPGAEVAVVSDVDDTVLVTGARSLRSMARLTFLHNARTRMPFAGVSALYRALEAGSDGSRSNPFFYVSSSPWNLYDLLVDFFRLQGLPRGVLLLRDLGLTPEHWVAGSHGHKEEKIAGLLATYPHLPFALIGDSGQEDPEIYARVAAAFPGRLRVIYIRDVSGPPRDAEVRRLAERTTEAGTPMLLVRDSVEAARDAAARGLILPDAVDGVRVTREEDEARPTPEEAVGEA